LIVIEAPEMLRTVAQDMRETYESIVSQRRRRRSPLHSRARRQRADRRFSSFAPAKASIPEREAFAEKAVIGMTQEALSSLQTLSAQLRAKLLELPEYRALTVIERTIEELSQIMNAPAARALDRGELQATLAGDSHDLAAAAPQRATAISALAGASQSRMAKAIADTIAAKAGSFHASSAGAVALGQPLNAAS
jgi:hypothetical protein